LPSAPGPLATPAAARADVRLFNMNTAAFLKLNIQYIRITITYKMHIHKPIHRMLYFPFTLKNIGKKAFIEISVQILKAHCNPVSSQPVLNLTLALSWV